MKTTTQLLLSERSKGWVNQEDRSSPTAPRSVQRRTRGAPGAEQQLPEAHTRSMVEQAVPLQTTGTIQKCNSACWGQKQAPCLSCSPQGTHVDGFVPSRNRLHAMKRVHFAQEELPSTGKDSCWSNWKRRGRRSRNEALWTDHNPYSHLPCATGWAGVKRRRKSQEQRSEVETVRRRCGGRKVTMICLFLIIMLYL